MRKGNRPGLDRSPNSHPTAWSQTSPRARSSRSSVRRGREGQSRRRQVWSPQRRFLGWKERHRLRHRGSTLSGRCSSDRSRRRLLSTAQIFSGWNSLTSEEDTSEGPTAGQESVQQRPQQPTRERAHTSIDRWTGKEGGVCVCMYTH